MPKLILAKGARGLLVERVQRRLLELGFSPGPVDGVYGDQTANAILAFQRDRQLEPTGEVDDRTWLELFGAAPPSLRDLCIQLAAAFEGAGFSTVSGNFDGAGITWGIIGFTLRHGAVRQIIQEVHQHYPELLEEAFGRRVAELLEIFSLPLARQIQWADSISTGPNKTGLSKPWRDGFTRLGQFEQVQAIQLRVAEERYFRPAVSTARAYQLSTELGLALAFDIHVQNGGINNPAASSIRRYVAQQPVRTELERRVIIAHAVADAADPQWRQDVLERKLTVAAGAGKVHGQFYILRNWGLSEDPFNL